MSSVTDAYTAIKLAVDTALTGKTVLPNPYQIENNNLGFLRDGYGIAYGGATVAQNRSYKDTWSNQEFLIHLTREVLNLESNPDPIRNTINTVHEDVVTVLKAVLDPTIFPSGVNYLETSPPQLFEGEDKQILLITVTVTARTQDTL